MVERAKPPTGWWWIELGFDADTVTFPAWDSLKDMQRQSYDDAMPAKLARRCTANLQKDLHRSWDSAACTGHSRPPHADTALFNTVAAACVTLKLKYTQGMNLVAAAILLGCDFSVPTAYAVMCTLLADAGLQAIYAANVPTVRAACTCAMPWLARLAQAPASRLAGAAHLPFPLPVAPATAGHVHRMLARVHAALCAAGRPTALPGHGNCGRVPAVRSCGADVCHVHHRG